MLIDSITHLLLATLIVEDQTEGSFDSQQGEYVMLPHCTPKMVEMLSSVLERIWLSHHIVGSECVVSSGVINACWLQITNESSF